MTEPRRLVVAINPSASFGRASDTGPKAVELLRAAGHEVHALVAPNWAVLMERAAESLESAPDALVVVGGDGMVHLGVNILAAAPDVPLGLIPSGTGNDLAKAAGIAEGDPQRAVAQLLDALERGPVSVDLGVAEWDEDGRRETRRFVGAVSCGFDALVNERANRMRRPKGQLRYQLAIAAALARLRPLRYRIEHDGGVLETSGVLASVCNNRSFGGGMLVVPDARLDDGLLDVFLVGELGRAAFLRIYPRVYSGRHVSDPRVTIFPTTRARVSGPDIVAYADGERLGPLPIDVAILPGALRLLAPVHDDAPWATAS